MLRISFGKSKPCRDVTLEEVLRHPIWMWAVDEETDEGQDETWTKPIISTTDVSDEIVHYYPTISFRIVGTLLYGRGDYDHANRTLFQFRVWSAGQWCSISEIDGLSTPTILQAIPTILGEVCVRFCCKSRNDWKANRADIGPDIS